MMTNPRLSTRRHLALMSATLTEESSSMRIMERLRESAATATFSQSSSVSLPVTSFLLSTKHSLEIRRRASCSRLISKEKKATFFPDRLPASSRMFKAMEVLPIPGRAARRIRSDLLRPEMARSRSVRPVDRPGMALSLSASSVRRSYTSSSTDEMGVSPRAARPWRMA